jgi:hypothetical protein
VDLGDKADDTEVKITVPRNAKWLDEATAAYFSN